MPLINIAKNLKVGNTQVIKVMHRQEQVWPPVPLVLCPVFTDDFERPDGPIGPNWPVPPQSSYYAWIEVPLLIEAGAAIALKDDWDAYGGNDNFGSGQWHEEIPGDQFIELCVYGLSYDGDPYDRPTQQMHGQIRLFCQGDPVTFEREEVWIDYSVINAVGGQLRVNSYWYYPDGSYGDDAIPTILTSPWAPAAADPTLCIRFESYTDGRHRVFLDVDTETATTLFAQGVSTSGHTGPFVGFRMLWWTDDFPTPPQGGSSPRVLWATVGQICCGDCIPDVMGSDRWEGQEGSSELCNSGGTGPKLLVYDAPGDFYYQTCDNIAGNIWPEPVMPPVSMDVTFANIGNVPTPAPGDPNTQDICAVELWRHDNAQNGDGLRVVLQIQDAGYRLEGVPPDATYVPYEANWYWWVEWYDDVVAHDYIYEFYPADSLPGRPGLGGDAFRVHLQVDLLGELVFSVDGIEYHRATVNSDLLPATPGKFGFWLDRGCGGFTCVPPPDDAPMASAVCMSIDPCPLPPPT